MVDKSYACRGYYPKEHIERMRKLLESKSFTDAFKDTNMRLPHIFRLAIGIGITELEKKHGIKVDAKNTDD